MKKTSILDGILNPSRIQEFAEYADKHEVFELLENLLYCALQDRPDDPISHMINTLKAKKVFGMVVFCPPGYTAEKETLLDNLAARLKITHLNSTQIIKNGIQKSTALGLQAKPYFESRRPVPDIVMMGLIGAALLELDTVGYILDGFPNSKEQWCMMRDKKLLPQKVVVLQPFPSSSSEYKIFQAELKTILSELNGGHYLSIPCPKGLAAHEYEILEQCQAFSAAPPRSYAPREFRIVVQGPPSSGKSVVCSYIQSSLGCVHVSPRNIILEQISCGSDNGVKLSQHLEDPSNAPETLMAELIAQRLSQEDCIERGWVLEGYPNNPQQAQLLQERSVTPNRVFWIDAKPESCLSRLKNKFSKQDEAGIREHIEASLATKKVLVDVYSYRDPSKPLGIVQNVKNVDESEAGMRKLQETVKSCLIRSIPAQIVPASV